MLRLCCWLWLLIEMFLEDEYWMGLSWFLFWYCFVVIVLMFVCVEVLVLLWFMVIVVMWLIL